MVDEDLVFTVRGLGQKMVGAKARRNYLSKDFTGQEDFVGRTCYLLAGFAARRKLV
jgi:hypothetical protein